MHDEDASVHLSECFICIAAGRISVTSDIQKDVSEHYWETLIFLMPVNGRH
jgi:hypothetical protein